MVRVICTEEEEEEEEEEAEVGGVGGVGGGGTLDVHRLSVMIESTNITSGSKIILKVYLYVVTMYYQH